MHFTMLVITHRVVFFFLKETALHSKGNYSNEKQINVLDCLAVA